MYVPLALAPRKGNPRTMPGRKREVDLSTGEAPTVGAVVPVAVSVRIAELAAERDVRRSVIIREILERGLEALDAEQLEAAG